MAGLPSLVPFLVGGDDRSIQRTVFRAIRHLLPDASAWRIGVDKKLRRFVDALAYPPADAIEFIDAVFLDLYPSTTRRLEEWERQFGLVGGDDAIARRKAIEAAWQATGGQSPAYLQSVVRAAGFDVYVHEWWVPNTSPRVVRDPRDYTEDPLLGLVQCGDDVQCGDAEALCYDWIAKDPGYLVNINLSGAPQPHIPDDPTKWRFFLYWGGETFGDRAKIPVSRREEFHRLLLKLCPAHVWIVTMVDYYIGDPVMTIDVEPVTINGDPVTVTLTV